jgi:propionyl-CoA carboxylase alpha chain
VVASGHAIEVRLCAERPREDYRPTPGTALHVRWPVGAGIRIDAAIETGSTVSPSYDSLVAKVMAHGDSRASAIARASSALRRLELDGLETNRALLSAILGDKVFTEGNAGIDYLDSRHDLRQAGHAAATRRRHAAAAGAALLQARAARSIVPVSAPGWRNVGTPLHADLLSDIEGELPVRAARPDLPIEVFDGGEWHNTGTAQSTASTVDLTSDGIRRRYHVRLSSHSAEVSGPEGQSSFGLRTEDDDGVLAGTAAECRAPLPGAISKVLVGVGDVVGDGDGLVVLEAMKMEHTLRASGAATVSQVLCTPGQQVDVGDLLVALEPA